MFNEGLERERNSIRAGLYGPRVTKSKKARSFDPLVKRFATCFVSLMPVLVARKMSFFGTSNQSLNQKCPSAALGHLKKGGGEGGIRTLDRGLRPYSGLANRRPQPLGDFSAMAGVSIAECFARYQRKVRPLTRGSQEAVPMIIRNEGHPSDQLWLRVGLGPNRLPEPRLPQPSKLSRT